MKNSITCLIPFYNEEKRIRTTLSALSKSKYINFVICVDDGSTDNTAAVIAKDFPHIKVKSLRKNSGKSHAIKEGVKEITTEYTLLFDADLSNINNNEINKALATIQQNPSIDMIILRRVIESKLLSVIRHDIVMSGQRVLRTEDSKKVFRLKPTKYELEMAINQYMIDNSKKVYWLPLSTRNEKKFFKVGFIKSLSLYYSQIYGFAHFRGFTGYLNQVRNFCKDKAA